MHDPSKTYQELIEENALLTQRIQDIEYSEAERKRAEEALWDSELKYQTIFETTGTTMLIVEEDMTISTANDSFKSLTGYTREEVEGKKKWTEFVEKGDLEKMVTQHQLRRADSSFTMKSYEFRLVHRDGSIKNILLTVDIIPGTKRSVASLMDITERKQMEEELLESEIKFKRFAEQALVGTYLLQDGVFQFVNPKFAQMFGFTVEECLNNMHFENLVYAEDIANVQEQIRRRIAREIEFIHYTFRGLKKNGQIFDVEIYGSAIVHKGRPAAAGTLLDITERKRIEEALRNIKDRYTLIMNNITDRIWLTDMNFKILWASESVASNRGYQLEETTPLPFEKLLTPDSLKTAIRTISEELTPQRLQQKDLDISKTLELEFFRKDGSTFWSEVTMRVLRDHEGTPSSILGVGRDITDRKQAENALRESEEKYRSIFETTLEGIYQTSPQGRYLKVNPAFALMLGYASPEDLIGSITDIGTQVYVNPDSRSEFKKSLSEHDRVENFEALLYRKDGTTMWGLINGVTVRNENGEILYYQGGMMDITERKQAEVEREKLKEQLVRAQKLESIGTLAGGIAHDFNNLLMGIQGYASLMLLDLEPSNPHYERLRRIEEQVHSGADLTRQLLGFARGGKYEVKPTDINEIIEKTSSMFGRTKKEVTFYRKYGQALQPVEVDQGQMEQVFMNLYVNAWQAMPGGGEICLETENVILDDERAFPYAVKHGEYVKITVTDTGTGMDEKTRARIFDPFFTTKEMGRGTGLGLATVYGIIKGHKGMIDVDSEPGHGTTFTIYLPASEKEAVKEKTAAGAIASGTETILLVDDEQMLVEVTRELLESLGYRVYAAGSGQEAIAVYMEKRDEIALVILDMIMPGISGGETYDRLKEFNPDIRVLLSSGYSINGKAQTIMDRGCNGFLQKPFHLEKLSQKVREILG